MPQWLQIVFMVVAMLAAIYVLAVLAQLIAASVLRRQTEPVGESVERAQHDVTEVRAQLAERAPDIMNGTGEMPFGPLYDQARDLLKKGLAQSEELQRRVDGLAAQQIAQQPASAAFKLAPMTREIAQRLVERKSAKNVTVQLTEVNDTLTRIKHIQEDIDVLPAREKDALLQLQKRSAEAAAMMEAEARPKQPLSEARDALRQANAYLGEADKLLLASQPPQPAVIIAHPLRLKADQQLQVVEEAVAGTKDKRTSSETAVAKSGEQLATLLAEIAQDESAELPRPQFKGRADALIVQADAAKAMIEQGDYDLVPGTLADVDQGVDAQQTALHALREQRLRVTAMIENASQRLATVTQWINETPQPFDLDITRAASQQLQDTADRLRTLIPHEDLAVMNTADDLDRQVEDVFRRAANVHAEFASGRHRFDELSATLNDYSVQAAASQARQVAAELDATNSAYWGDLTPDKLRSAADELTAGWQAISHQVTAIKESELQGMLERMDEVRATYGTASDLHGAAVKALTQLDADKLQANTALNDDVMIRLLDDSDAIAQATPSLAGRPGIIRARIDELRREMSQDAPDYGTINANAQRLRHEADEFVSGYRRQVQDVLAQINQTAESLRSGLAKLDDLHNDPLIDFSSTTAPVSARATAWLAATVNDDAITLDSAQTALSEGQEIERETAALVSHASALRNSMADKSATAQTALAETNGLLSAAQAGLQTMTGAGSERWGAAMLDDAREPMIEALELLAQLEHPTHRFTVDQLSATHARIESLTDKARQQADSTQSDVAQRAAKIKQRQVELSHAYELADDAAKDHPERQVEWDDVRKNITQLEQRWTSAQSYDEALDAMTQAVQRAEEFAAIANTTSA